MSDVLADLLPFEPLGVKVAGVDVATLGLLVQEWAGHLTPALVRPPTQPVPGGGERATGAAGQLAPRVLTIAGSVPGIDAADAAATVAALLAHCAGAAGSGGDGTGAASAPVAITLPTWPARQWTGALDVATTATVDAPALSGVVAVVLNFVCPDPYAYDLAPTVVALSAVAAAVPVGTARHGALIALPGPWTTRTLTYADGAGVVRGTLTVTAPAGAVLAGETVEIDLAAQTITHVSAAAVRTPHAAWRTAGRWFRLLPAHLVAGVAPTLTLDAGAGTATVTRAYR